MWGLSELVLPDDDDGPDLPAAELDLADLPLPPPDDPAVTPAADPITDDNKQLPPLPSPGHRNPFRSLHLISSNHAAVNSQSLQI